MLLNIFYKVSESQKRRILCPFIDCVVKHANVGQIIGANQNEEYPNITLREDISLLDLAVGGNFNHYFSSTKCAQIILGQYVIPLSYVLQLLKYAFNYQVYDIFEALMEPVSELISRTDGTQTSLLALLQILYEIEQCEKARKAAQLAKNQPPGGDKKKRSKSPSKGKDTGSSKPTPEAGKSRIKKSKAVKDLINAAKGTRGQASKNKDTPIDQEINEEEQERSLEELLEDLCFLLLTDPQIV